MIFSENRLPPRITCGAGFFRIMLWRRFPLSDTAETTGAASGGVRTLLRLEGLALFTGMTLLYGVWDGSWWVYAILFVAPDLSFAGYLAGPRAGAAIYNAAHSYMAPMALMITGFALSAPLVLSIAMIWLAHIGIDRALGYGLKNFYRFGFDPTRPT